MANVSANINLNLSFATLNVRGINDKKQTPIFVSIDKKS